jgi:hypothetical protein
MKIGRLAAAACVAVATAGALAPAAAASPGTRAVGTEAALPGRGAAGQGTASRGPQAAERGTAGPGGAASWPAAEAGRGKRLRAVLLVNGARVMAGLGTVDRGPTVLLPGGEAGSLVGLSLGGRTYLLPPQALPYLGRGLAPSLFDVTALASQERAGRLPVTLAYRGTLPGLPGVTITHAAGGAAQGYLTEAGAHAFGAALARQFAGDHARGSYGQDGMFANGLSVALAGAGVPARAAPSRRQFPMRTLTVTGTALTGKPDTGDAVTVINVDDIGRFDDPVGSQNFFYHGSARFSVPAGHYMAIGTFYDFTGTRLTGFHAVALPQFTVSGPATTVHLDARSATSRLQWITPRPATRQCSNDLDIERFPAVGPAFSVTYLVCRGGLWVSPVESTRLTGALHTVANGQLTSPPHYHGTPYEYDLAYTAPEGVIPPLRYVVRPAALATEDARYYQPVRAPGGWQAAGLFSFQFLRGGSSVVFGREVSLPGRKIQYYATGRSLLWFDSYFQSLSTGAGGQTDSGRVLRPGERLAVGWNAFPLHPAPNTNLLGAVNPSATLPSASRAGGMLTLDITPFSDNVPGHTGSGFSPVRPGTVRGRYAVFAGGTRIAAGNAVRAAKGHADLRTSVRLPHGTQDVRFVLTAARTGPLYRLSAASRTMWSWRSVSRPGAALPPGWTCGNATRACVVQPMMTLRYAVTGMSLTGSAHAGPQVVRLSVGHLQLAKAAAVTRAAMSVSFDGGKTWHPAKVAGHGGSYTATFTAPAGTTVSLRTSAADAAGGAITETITGAYQTAA